MFDPYGKVTWNDFTHDINALMPPVKIVPSEMHHEHKGLRYEGKGLPVSISENEFNYIRDYVIKNKFKSAIEIGTGIGISAIAIGLGLKKTGGKLLTIDSYEEELLNVQPKKLSGKVNVDAVGADFLEWALYQFNIEEQVTPLLGWFPKDTIYDVGDFVIANGNFDLVMIDAAKNDYTFIDIMRAVVPYMNRRKFSIIIHDVHTLSEKTDNYILNVFERNIILVHKFGDEKQAFPLALVEGGDIR